MSFSRQLPHKRLESKTGISLSFIRELIELEKGDKVHKPLAHLSKCVSICLVFLHALLNF